MILGAEIEFLSDWRVGTGAGRPAGVDRVTARDQDKLPFVPAKTLTGVWRDAAEQLAAALDTSVPDGAHPWADRVTLLFGDQPALGGPVSAPVGGDRLLTIRPARLPEPLIERLKAPDREPLRRAMTTVRAGVRIDRDGLAVDHHLRFDEVARVGITLRAEVELDCAGIPDEEQARIVALLKAAAAFIDGIGAGRRRGLGRCQVSLADDRMDETQLEALLRSDKPVPPTVAPTEPERYPVATPSDAKAEVVLRLDLTARTPLLLEPKVTGNVHVGAPTVPGGHLLPIVCAVIDQLLGDGEGRRSVRSGELMVTQARPNVAGERGRPMPFCMARFKDGDGFKDDDGVRNGFAPADDPKAAAGGAAIRQRKGLRDGFVGSAPDKETLPPYRRPKLTTRVHNSIDDDRQRPLSPEAGGTGGLYVYAALPAGERHSALLRLRGETAARLAGRLDELAHRLGGRRRLGRSKRDDYGAADLIVSHDEGLDSESSRPLRPGDVFSLWLLSDLVPGGVGGFAPGPEALLQALRESLIAAGASPELELAIEERPTLQGTVACAALRSRRVDGWQTAWGLPRASLAALAAGSCALVEVRSGAIPADALACVARSGIGERTAEGYGEVALDDPLLCEPMKDRAAAAAPRDDPTGAATPTELAAEHRKLAQLLEDAAWRERIRWSALTVAEGRRGDLFGAPMPSRSQIARVRSAAMPAHGARPRVLAMLPTDDKAKERWLKKKWSADALESLREIATDGGEEALFGKLSRDGSGTPSWADITLTEDERELRRRHADFAFAALLDATARAATVEDHP